MTRHIQTNETAECSCYEVMGDNPNCEKHQWVDDEPVEQIKSTTPGSWIVQVKNGEYYEVVTVAPERKHDDLVALVPNLADAALFAVSRDMLDTLITIQAELNSTMEEIDFEMINEQISNVVFKLANEAGEEL